MGSYNSVEDFQPNENQSMEYSLHIWNKQAPKNWDYYTGTRFFKISRSLYPDQYERGVIYSYSYLPQYHYSNFIQEDDEDERSF
jgi:hypothetical protein